MKHGFVTPSESHRFCERDIVFPTKGQGDKSRPEDMGTSPGDGQYGLHPY